MTFTEARCWTTLSNLICIKQIGFLDSLVDLRITKFYSLYYLFLDTSSIEVAAELEMEFGIEEYCKYIFTFLELFIFYFFEF